MKQGTLQQAQPARGPLLRPHRRTNPLIWCCAIVCVTFSVLLILAGILTLVIFLAIKPRYPSFDAAGASLNGAYLDSSIYLNSDFTLLANFTNPNRRIDLEFEHVGVELYFYDRLLATQALQPFELARRGEWRVMAVHMVSSEVYLTPPLATELRRQVGQGRVVYGVRGTFRVRATVGGGIRLSYWLYARCVVELTGPPSGVMVARNCRTKK